MFKPGDRAWHPQYGWGGIFATQATDGRIIYFENEKGSTSPLFRDGFEQESDLNPVIFPKEQKFDLSEPEPEIGTWGWFWDDNSGRVTLFNELIKIHDGQYFAHGISLPYKHFSPYPSLPQHIKDMMEGKG